MRSKHQLPIYIILNEIFNLISRKTIDSIGNNNEIAEIFKRNNLNSCKKIISDEEIKSTFKDTGIIVRIHHGKDTILSSIGIHTGRFKIFKGDSSFRINNSIRFFIISSSRTIVKILRSIRRNTIGIGVSFFVNIIIMKDKLVYIEIKKIIRNSDRVSTIRKS